MSNPVEPNHYTDMSISPLEYIEANQSCFDWSTANVIKYVSRYKKKNGLEDLLKSHYYLCHAIHKEYEALSDDDKNKYYSQIQKVRKC
jgi:hypothetical protein